MTATEDSQLSIDWHTKWTFMSAIFIDIAFLGYLAWDERYGKVLTYIFLVFGGLISIAILLWPHHLYNQVVISNTGNSIDLNII